MFKKFVDLFQDVTVNLLKQYQNSAVDLAKIEAASFYLKMVKVVREHFLIFAAMLFCLVLLAIAVIALPIAFVIVAPVAFKTKAMMLGILCLADIILPLAMLNRFLSEDTWMKISKTDQVLEKVIG